MSDSATPIMPSTKVGALLDEYPELEEVLIGIAPPFKKLKKTLLRKSVAKVATLQQAATVGRVPVDELVNKLRVAVGQAPIASEDVGDTVSYFSDQPDWFDAAKIVASIDERDAGEKDPMPLATLLQKATRLKQAEIVELTTTFIPAPGIDIMKKKGFLVWSVQEESELIRTYFSKPTG
jgi:hypothetical protein